MPSIKTPKKLIEVALTRSTRHQPAKNRFAMGIPPRCICGGPAVRWQLPVR